MSLAPEISRADRSAAERVAVLTTVAVFVYNHAPFVGECLDSILTAGCAALEILVFDDASSDGSREAIEAWRAAHPSAPLRAFFRSVNLGLTKNLNAAVREASGEFIALLAADDRLLPDGLACRVEFLELNPRLLGCFADCHVVNRDGHRIYESGIEDFHADGRMKKRVLRHPRLVAPSVVRHWCVPGPVFMLRREAFATVGLYDETTPFGEDWDMYLRLAALGRLGFLDRYVADYRLHGGNAIFNRRAALAASIEVLLRRHVRGFHGLSRLFLAAEQRRYRARRKGRLHPVNLWWKAIVEALRRLSWISLVFQSRLARPLPPSPG